MAQVRIDKDEVYPVFSLLPADWSSAWGRLVDMPGELIERVHRAAFEWNEVQEILEALYNARPATPTTPDTATTPTTPTTP